MKPPKSRPPHDTLQAALRSAFSFDQAAHTGSGYLGLQFQDGPRSGTSDTLNLSGLQANAAL